MCLTFQQVISMDPFSGMLKVAGKIDRTLYDRFNFNVLVADENAVTSGQIGTGKYCIRVNDWKMWVFLVEV